MITQETRDAIRAAGYHGPLDSFDQIWQVMPKVIKTRHNNYVLTLDAEWGTDEAHYIDRSDDHDTLYCENYRHEGLMEADNPTEALAKLLRWGLENRPEFEGLKGEKE